MEARNEVTNEHLTRAKQADSSSYKIVISVYGQLNFSMTRNNEINWYELYCTNVNFSMAHAASALAKDYDCVLWYQVEHIVYFL